MKKMIVILLACFSLFCLIAAMQFTSHQQDLPNQETDKATLSVATIKSLESRGFAVSGQYLPVRSPRMLDSTNLPEIVHLKMSLDVRQAKNLQITWMGVPAMQKTVASQNDTILVEGFEGDFPGANWQLSGDPTWGKSDYTKHGGQNSVFCAKGGTAGVTPPANYPNNMNAMMVFGPFDLSNASVAFLRFWFWLETEINKDIFWYGASSDGNIFGLIGLSGSTGTSSPAWEQTSLNLADVPDLGSLIGQSSVWIAFGFSSDSTGTRRGAFVDDVEVQKAAVGTGISGYLKGSLSPAGNPYIAFDHVGVAQGDSLEILPGCELRFDPAKEFVVHGFLHAQGTESDSLKFTSNKTNPRAGDWVGIGFYTSDTSATVQYAKIEYGGYGSQSEGGIFAQGRPKIMNNKVVNNSGSGVYSDGNPQILRNIISHNSTGVSGSFSSGYIEGNIISENQSGISASFTNFIIKNNHISNNNGPGIIAGGSDIIVINNIIENNGAEGIFVGGGSLYFTTKIGLRAIGNLILNNRKSGIILDDLLTDAMLHKNVIKGNVGNGVDFSGINNLFVPEPQINIFNNTIVSNSGSGIYCGSKGLSNSRFIANIVMNNGQSGIYSQAQYFHDISFNDLFNNAPNFNLSSPGSLGVRCSTNTKGDSCDIFFNINENPLFVNEGANDLHLQIGSPCIDAGHPNSFFNDSDSTKNDIGFTGGGQLFINFSKYDFSKTSLGISRQVDLIIENLREQAISLSSFQLSDIVNFSLVQSGSIIILPFESKKITVKYTPQNVGSQSLTLTISCNDFYGTTSAEIIFTGEGISGTNVSGSISGIWTKACSPYIILANVEVPTGKKLIIEPGVDVRFDGPYYFKVKGQLEAIGALNDSVVFTRHRSTGESGGDGIQFYTNNSDTNKFEYCIIEKMKETLEPFQKFYPPAVDVFRSTISFDHSRISDNNRPAIEIRESTAFIRNCVISDNAGTAVKFYQSRGEIRGSTIKKNRAVWPSNGRGISCSNSKISIKNNVVKENSGGISLAAVIATVLNNIIINNSGDSVGGISVNGDSLVLVNNVIYNNSASEMQSSITGGFTFWGARFLQVCNNIFQKNRHTLFQVGNKQITPNTPIKYCNVEGGYPGVGNIASDPLFIDPENEYFHLQSTSSCIDAGNPDSLYNDPEDPQRVGFAFWPAQGTIRNDMGAYGGPFAVGSSINFRPYSFNLIFPADGDTLNTQTPGFTWRRSIDPNPGDKVRYTLQLDFKQDFSNPVSFSNISDTTYLLQMNLPADLTYYWRVIAADSAGLQRTSKEVFRFTIGNVAPQAFNLFHPENKDTVFTLTPQLDWEPAEDPNLGDAIRYTLFYAQDSSFAKADTMKDISSNSFQCDWLADHQTYFWKIKAEDSQGASTFSNQVFQFFTFAAPMPFHLISPAIGDTVKNDTLIFSWRSAFDPNPDDSIHYTLLYDTSMTFIKPIEINGIADTSFIFTDSLANNTRYYWTIMAVDKDSFTTASSDTFSFLVRYLPTGVAGSKSAELPTEFALSQNYPNPFNPTTTINYQLPKAQEVKLAIYNLRGQRVATLVDRKEAAGYYSIIWDGKDEYGKHAASGVYLYRIETDGFFKVRKLVLLR